jgi:hypothetical protein
MLQELFSFLNDISTLKTQVTQLIADVEAIKATLESVKNPEVK